MKNFENNNVKDFENFLTVEKNINQYNHLEHTKKKNLIYQRLDSLIIDNLQKNVQHIQIDITLTENYAPSSKEKEEFHGSAINSEIYHFLYGIWDIDGLVFTHFNIDIKVGRGIKDVPHYLLIIGFVNLTGDSLSVINYLQKSLSEFYFPYKIKMLNTFIEIQNAYKQLFDNRQGGYKNHKIDVFVRNRSGYTDFFKGYSVFSESKEFFERVYFHDRKDQEYISTTIQKCELIPFLTISKDITPDEKKSLYICLGLILYCKLSNIKFRNDKFYMVDPTNAGHYTEWGSIDTFKEKKIEILEKLALEFPIQLQPIILYRNNIILYYNAGVQKFKENLDWLN